MGPATLVVTGLAQGGTRVESYSNGRPVGAVVDRHHDGGAVGCRVRVGGWSHVAVDDFAIEPVP